MLMYRPQLFLSKGLQNPPLSSVPFKLGMIHQLAPARKEASLRSWAFDLCEEKGHKDRECVSCGAEATGTEGQWSGGGRWERLDV